MDGEQLIEGGVNMNLALRKEGRKEGNGDMQRSAVCTPLLLLSRPFASFFSLPCNHQIAWTCATYPVYSSTVRPFAAQLCCIQEEPPHEGLA